MEKQNKELQEEISDLQLGISIRDEDMGKLQEQIEKMKCCQNCADGESCENNGLVYVCDKWRFEK